MSVPKRGLGRGLDALLGEERPVATGLTEILVDAIRPNPRQPRQNFDAAALEELQRSITHLGVLVPIIVRQVGSGTKATYELIAGERRWRAASAAHLATIPAIVRDADDRTSLELAVVENLQRQDLDPLEEAMGFQYMLDEHAFTQERLAERLGKSRPAITNALRLLGLSDAIKAQVRSGALTVGHARALLAIPEAQREEVARRVETRHLSVRDVERLAKRREAPKRKTGRPKSADLIEVEKRLRYALGAPVAIVPGATGGRLEIRYGADDDLARIVDVLLGEPA